MFTKSNSPHGLTCIETDNLSNAQCRIVCATITNSFMDSDDYKLRTACGAFLQGYEEAIIGNSGWILIEFWTEDEDAIDDFISHLNAKLV